MNIKIHTMYFLPEFGSAPVLMNELAAYLSLKGHRVEVITTMPRKSDDKRYKWRFFSFGEDPLGFVIKRFRVGSFPGVLGRLLAWTLYSLFSAVNVLFTFKKDILFLRLPPLQLGISGILAKKLRGSRFIVNLQDIHPDLAVESGILKNKLLIRTAYLFERWIYSYADLIIVISEGFKNNLLKKGVNAKKIKIIPNWVDTEFVRPLARDNRVSDKLALKDKFVVMYAGTISLSSIVTLNSLLDAAALLQNDKDILVVIVGEGLKKDSLVEKAEKMKLTNILFTGFLPHEDIPYLFASADLLLVPVDVNKTELSLPSKLYNCMASGRPILSLAPNNSEIDSFVKDSGCGVSIDPGDINKIRDVILELKADTGYRSEMGKRGRDYVLNNFSKDKVLKVYEDTLSLT
jgi:colanic acid biosynthesis glycosyl transferase WcaI